MTRTFPSGFRTFERTAKSRAYARFFLCHRPDSYRHTSLSRQLIGFWCSTNAAQMVLDNRDGNWLFSAPFAPFHLCPTTACRDRLCRCSNTAAANVVKNRCSRVRPLHPSRIASAQHNVAPSATPAAKCSRLSRLRKNCGITLHSPTACHRPLKSDRSHKAQYQLSRAVTEDDRTP